VTREPGTRGQVVLGWRDSPLGQEGLLKDAGRAAVLRYLKLLGVEEREPSLAHLRAIVGRHLVRVPFENVSKLLLFAREGAGRPVTLSEFLDGLEHHDLGGTCYSSNPFLAELLGAIGYDAALLGADMSEPNVHTSIRVRLDGRDYHVDVGYAAPLREPIALDELPYEVSSGRDRYVFTQDSRGHEMVRFTDGARCHGYVVHGPPRLFPFFHPTIMASFEPGRTFMRCLRITRFLEQGGVIELRNRRLLVVSARGARESAVESLPELRRAVNEQFRMPRCDVEQAVAMLEQLTGCPFFGASEWRDSTD